MKVPIKRRPLAICCSSLFSSWRIFPCFQLFGWQLQKKKSPHSAGSCCCCYFSCWWSWPNWPCNLIGFHSSPVHLLRTLYRQVRPNELNESIHWIWIYQNKRVDSDCGGVIMNEKRSAARVRAGAPPTDFRSHSVKRNGTDLLAGLEPPSKRMNRIGGWWFLSGSPPLQPVTLWFSCVLILRRHYQFSWLKMEFLDECPVSYLSTVLS